jgi:hypothetical protein
VNTSVAALMTLYLTLRRFDRNALYDIMASDLLLQQERDMYRASLSAPCVTNPLHPPPRSTT